MLFKVLVIVVCGFCVGFTIAGVAALARGSKRSLKSVYRGVFVGAGLLAIGAGVDTGVNAVVSHRMHHEPRFKLCGSSELLSAAQLNSPVYSLPPRPFLARHAGKVGLPTLGLSALFLAGGLRKRKAPPCCLDKNG